MVVEGGEMIVMAGVIKTDLGRKSGGLMDVSVGFDAWGSRPRIRTGCGTRLHARTRLCRG